MPYINYKDFPESENRTKTGQRNAQMFENASDIPLEDRERVSFWLLDYYLENGKLRTNRPDPTNPKHVQATRMANKIDGDTIDQLGNYKNDIDVRQADKIPLSPYQQEWVDYILGKSDQIPKMFGLVTILKHVNAGERDAKLKELDDVPF